MLLSNAALQPAQAQETMPTFRLVGNAVQHAPDRIGLTTDQAMHTGAAWLPEKQRLRDGFTITFDWQIRRPSNPRRGSDGFALVIHNAPVLFPEAALGDGRNHLGYGGLAKSLAIEFDTTKNLPIDFGGGKGDPNDNHISVQSRGREPNNANSDFSLGLTTQTVPGLPLFVDGQPHTTTVVYTPSAADTPGNMRIFLDNKPTPVLNVAVNLDDPQILDADGMAWVGFTAATGRHHQAHDILAFAIEPAAAAANAP